MRIVGTVQLANGKTRDRSEEIEVSVDGSVVLMKVHNFHEVTLKFPPSIARRVVQLLSEVAGPERPDLRVVK